MIWGSYVAARPGSLGSGSTCSRTRGYETLLGQIARNNDKSNFLALALELNFAYHFEASGRELTYEVTQDAARPGLIDFLRRLPTGERIFFELRLLQQSKAVTDEINNQLAVTGAYTLLKDGELEQGEVVRIQSTILSKAQDEQGNPTKFHSTAHGTLNILVIDASDSISGSIDIHDCKLAA